LMHTVFIFEGNVFEGKQISEKGKMVRLFK